MIMCSIKPFTFTVLAVLTGGLKYLILGACNSDVALVCTHDTTTGQTTQTWNYENMITRYFTHY